MKVVVYHLVNKLGNPTENSNIYRVRVTLLDILHDYLQLLIGEYSVRGPIMSNSLTTENVMM